MIKTYARMFFTAMPVFFAGMLAANLPIMKFRQAFENALATGILLGAAIALIMGTLHIVKARKAAGGLKGDIYAIKQSREFKSSRDYDRLFTAVTHYLKNTARFVLTENDQVSGKISASSPFNFTTFGSRVSVRLERSQEGGTLVKILSRPLYFFTLADYGENVGIVRALEEHLRAGDLL